MIKGQWRRNQGEVTKAVEGEEGEEEEVKSSALCCRDALWIGRFADAAQSYTEDCEGFWEFRPRSWYLWVRKPDITLSCQCSQSSTQDRFEFYYYYNELLDNVLVVGCLSVGVTNITEALIINIHQIFSYFPLSSFIYFLWFHCCVRVFLDVFAFYFSSIFFVITLGCLFIQDRVSCFSCSSFVFHILPWH